MKLSLVAILAVSLTACATDGYRPVPEGYADPVASLADTGMAGGKLHSVEGVVSLTPIAGHTYFLVGLLKTSGSTVWIQDAETATAVTEIVTAREGA